MAKHGSHVKARVYMAVTCPNKKLVRLAELFRGQQPKENAGCAWRNRHFPNLERLNLSRDPCR